MKKKFENNKSALNVPIQWWNTTNDIVYKWSIMAMLDKNTALAWASIADKNQFVGHYEQKASFPQPNAGSWNGKLLDSL